jgi:hypothetical protein
LKNNERGLRYVGIFIFAMTPGVTLAYVDPGNGAYMVQALFALIGAAFFYLRHPIRSLKELWHWLSTRGKPTPAEQPEDAASVSGTGTAQHELEGNAISDGVRDDRMVR